MPQCYCPAPQLNYCIKPSCLQLVKMQNFNEVLCCEKGKHDHWNCETICLIKAALLNFAFLYCNAGSWKLMLLYIADTNVNNNQL